MEGYKATRVSVVAYTARPKCLLWAHIHIEVGHAKKCIKQGVVVVTEQVGYGLQVWYGSAIDNKIVHIAIMNNFPMTLW